jgi:hypothetical protein
MAKTTDLECDWCGSLRVGENNPTEFWRSVCPKPGSCTAKIVSRYLPDQDTASELGAEPRECTWRGASASPRPVSTQ